MPLSVTALLCSACLSDLDTKPLTESLYLAEDAWRNPSSYEEFLSKIYAGLALSGNSGAFGVPDITAADQGEATFLRTWWNLQEICTDEVLATEDNESMRGLVFAQWNSNNNFVALNYTRLYMNIAYANEFLRETTEPKLKERGFDGAFCAKVETMRAEARALRALNYYCLMDLYANIPFIDEKQEVGKTDAKQKGRDFFFTWIESELNEIRSNLPDCDMAHYGMFNKAAAAMLLAKLYLNAEVYIGRDMYTECISELKQVFSFGYALDEDYSRVFCADNHRSPEIIFPIIYDGRHAATFGGTTYLIAASSKSDMNPTSTRGFTQAWSNIHATEVLEDVFAPGDKRAMFWKENRSHDNEVWYDFTKGWSVVKYSNLNADGSTGSNTSHADTDFPFFRLPDAYLMYAEAFLRGGQGGSRETALSLMNELRSRAALSPLSNIELTLDTVLDERMRELYWEAHRRQDLIRFGKFVSGYKWPWKNGVYTGTADIDPKYKIYPIPSVEVAINPHITQNDGY